MKVDQERPKHHVELVGPRTDALAAPESSEQPFGLVPQLVEFAFVVPPALPVRFLKCKQRRSMNL